MFHLNIVAGEMQENQAAIWDYLKLLFESKDVIKVAHNLAFESNVPLRKRYRPSKALL
jgi:hypothetical protein